MTFCTGQCSSWSSLVEGEECVTHLLTSSHWLEPGETNVTLAEQTAALAARLRTRMVAEPSDMAAR